MITIQSSGAQRLFDHTVYLPTYKGLLVSNVTVKSSLMMMRRKKQIEIKI